MKCPFCNKAGHVEIDLHADGFSRSTFECGDCGGVWTFSGETLTVIKHGTKERLNAYSDFVCPTCKSLFCIETDLHAFQFHEEIQECANCGTVCSLAHDLIEVVADSQDRSFLSTTSDSVESDDYVFV
ncbi:MAG: hypothetical protein JRF07_00545 [Deltaproteobacteria bacterium]|jgi:transcription elongation factor Elf1|nr:hypothetical protein [Deltaproteobacteria bacterium]MBW2476441.1 hypothetical protein [Deltaproteobacteria bacterium]